MKATIELEKCSGHARCHQADPDLFELDDSGYALTHDVEIPTGAEDRAREAAASCPERAITLT